MYSVIFITGVSGTGKTTIGQSLGQILHLPFYDGDDFHPISNIQKMKAGIPLTDEDRSSWLEAIHQFAIQKLRYSNLIIACSALKEKYRRHLSRSIDENSIWIVLLANPDLLLHRMQTRKNHFMPPTLLSSQLDIFEIPEYGLHLDASLPVETQIGLIQNYLNNA